MQVKIVRNPSGSTATEGEMFVDGVHECYTLEDVVREVEGQPLAQWKVQDRTAIPRGRYRVTQTWSPKFGAMMPLLLNVPGFEAIRIHPGNTARDTDGCILVGEKIVDADFIGNSRAAFEQFEEKLSAALNTGTDVWLEIA